MVASLVKYVFTRGFCIASPILQYRKGDSTAWVYFIDQKIPKEATSFIMRNLTANSPYLIKLAAQNEFGMGEFDLFHSPVRTLKSEPSYVPEVGVKGITWNSISLGWDSPPSEPDISDYIAYYKITRETSTEEVRDSLPEYIYFGAFHVLKG